MIESPYLQFSLKVRAFPDIKPDIIFDIICLWIWVFLDGIRRNVIEWLRVYKPAWLT